MLKLGILNSKGEYIKFEIINVRNSKRLINVEGYTRDAIVPYYIHLILFGHDEEIERVNKLILSKWALSGLTYIKEKAWKKVNILKQNTWDHATIQF